MIARFRVKGRGEDRGVDVFYTYAVRGDIWNLFRWRPINADGEWSIKFDAPRESLVYRRLRHLLHEQPDGPLQLTEVTRLRTLFNEDMPDLVLPRRMPDPLDLDYDEHDNYTNEA